MKNAWNPASGFEALKWQIDNRLPFTVFADAAILPMDAVQPFITVIMRTGIFTTQYTMQHTLLLGQRDYNTAMIWWAKKVLVKI